MAGIRVIALVRNEIKGKSRFEAYLHRSDFHLMVQDVNSPITIEEDVHFIIHAASQASPKFYGTDPVGTLSANIIGTLNLLKLASEKKTERYLYFSSSEVYGTLESDKIPTKEDDFGYVNPTEVRSCYAESKRMGENICVSWMHQYGIPALIVRPFHTYGPGMDLTDGRVYADFISNMVEEKDIVMKSDGSAIRAFCYIRDATEGFLTVLLSGKPGLAYNVGNEEGEASILELAEKLISIYPEKNLKIHRFEKEGNYYLKSTVSRIVPQTSRMKELGWIPQTTIEDGFSRTIQSYQ